MIELGKIDTSIVIFRKFENGAKKKKKTAKQRAKNKTMGWRAGQERIMKNSF